MARVKFGVVEANSATQMCAEVPDGANVFKITPVPGKNGGGYRVEYYMQLPPVLTEEQQANMERELADLRAFAASRREAEEAAAVEKWNAEPDAGFQTAGDLVEELGRDASADDEAVVTLPEVDETPETDDDEATAEG